MMRMTISVRSFTIAAVLGLAAMQPPPSIHADVVTLNAVADANLADLAGVGVFDSLNDLNASSYGLVAENFRGYSASLDFERRAVIEFNLAPLASAAVIQSLSFTFETVSIANGPHAINVVGFADDGVAGLDDATRTGTLLGSYDYDALGLGVHTITLDVSLLQSLLGSSSFLGLRLESPDVTANTSIASVEQGSSFTAPSVRVEFRAVPEPASLAMLSAGALGVLGLARHRKAA